MKRIFMLSAVLVLLSGCSSISVRRDYDRTTDFSQLKTYAWEHAEQPETGDPRIDNDLMDERVRAAVNRELAAKGLVAGSKSDADFLVAYFITYKQRIGGSSVSFGIGTGSYGRYGSVGYNTSISDYDEGHLTIDIMDSATTNTIWRGVGVRTTYETAKPDKITKIVNQAVSKILKKFPPK